MRSQAVPTLARPTPVGTVAPATSRTAPLPGLLGLVALASCALTLLVPGLLRGPAAMNGSARGTALVILLVGLPVLALSGRAAAGSLRAEVVRTGTTAYLLYNAVMFVFATPFNRIFLLYVAMLGLAVWTLVDRTLHLWRRAVPTGGAVPRWTALYLGAVVALNAAAWLAAVLPAAFGADPADALAGTGLTTNPVIVQDLAFWLPVMAWLALGVWRSDPPRVALAGAGAVFWVLESLGIAVDQWWGHAADPSSTVVSVTLVPAFFILAAVGLVPAVALLHAATPDAPPLVLVRHHGPAALLLTLVGALNAIAAAAGGWGLASGVLDLGAPIEDRLPGGSTLLAAAALVLAVAVPNAVLAVLAARGDRRTSLAAVAVGTLLVTWIAVQMAVIREPSFFQPLYAAIGLVTVWLGLVIRWSGES